MKNLFILHFVLLLEGYVFVNSLLQHLIEILIFFKQNLHFVLVGKLRHSL